MKLLHTVGLAEKALNYPDELSVKVIKGLVSDTEYTISDDPEYSNMLRLTVNQSS